MSEYDYNHGFTPEELPEFPERTTNQILQELAQLLFVTNTHLEHIRAALGQSGSARSSVELAQTSKGVNLTVKSYEGSDIEVPLTDAIAGFATGYREIKQQQMVDWEETVRALNGGLA